jgi:hypothetical protein
MRFIWCTNFTNLPSPAVVLLDKALWLKSIRIMWTFTDCLLNVYFQPDEKVTNTWWMTAQEFWYFAYRIWIHDFVGEIHDQIFIQFAVVIRTHVWAMTTWTNFNLILDLFELLVNTQNIITHKCWLLNIITILTKYFETIEVKHRRILKKVIGIVKKRMIKCKDMLYYREMIYFSWATIIFVQPYNICFC